MHMASAKPLAAPRPRAFSNHTLMRRVGRKALGERHQGCSGGAERRRQVRAPACPPGPSELDTARRWGWAGVHRLVQRARTARLACLPCPHARPPEQACAECGCLRRVVRRCFCRPGSVYASAIGAPGTSTPQAPFPSPHAQPDHTLLHPSGAPSERPRIPSDRIPRARSGEALQLPPSREVKSMG